jgi:hypothetical protein
MSQLNYPTILNFAKLFTLLLVGEAA